MDKNGADYPVGYKKPPRSTQFKPGHSGNPNGRPKKVATLPDILWKELRTRIAFVSNGKRRSISLLQAIIKQNLKKAVNGDLKAAAMIFNQLKESEPETGVRLSELVHEFRAVYAQREAESGADRKP